MLQMPARVKFITRRGPGSLVHGVGNHLPRVKHFADNDHALTKPILQERPASKHQSCSWVHREDIGAVGRGVACFYEGSGAGLPSRPQCWNHFIGDTGRVRKRGAGRAGLSASPVPENMGWDLGACILEGGTAANRRQFVTWRLQQYLFIQAPRTGREQRIFG